MNMQTFLPYPSFVRSVQCLDRARLGKQRVEAWQILRALSGESKGWVNHPAVKMWRGHERALAQYGSIVCSEWLRRGYVDNMKERFRRYDVVTFDRPPWFGNEAFHAAHRSNLLRKDPVWYGRFGWTETADLPYVWPTEEGR